MRAVAIRVAWSVGVGSGLCHCRPAGRLSIFLHFPSLRFFFFWAHVGSRKSFCGERVPRTADWSEKRRRRGKTFFSFTFPARQPQRIGRSVGRSVSTMDARTVPPYSILLAAHSNFDDCMPGGRFWRAILQRCDIKQSSVVRHACARLPGRQHC